MSLEEIEEYISHTGGIIKVTKIAEAGEYRETLAIINSFLQINDIVAIKEESKIPESLL